MTVSQQRHRLGPGQGGTFARGEKIAVVPGCQVVQAPLAFTLATRLHCMHVQAECTAIEL
ncbi:hypothetical protein D3C80_2229440 [compost metagenome]